VRLPRPAPPRPSRYEQFFGAPVFFDADCLELVYAHEALQRRPSKPGELFAGQTSTNVTAVPALTRTASAFAELVQKQVLASLMEGVPSLSAVAKQLGVSGRTLRRRLAEARTGYAQLVDEVRQRRALVLASRGELDVTRLAELSGFADASSFARAFRRWTGQRPLEFMRRVRDNE
jgi:AraC-like DNA-binding protein